MNLFRCVLALIEYFDPILQEWKRQDQLNARSYQLSRRGFTFDQKQGRVAEAVPAWMVQDGQSQRKGSAGGSAGADTTESLANRTHLRKNPGPGGAD